LDREILKTQDAENALESEDLRKILPENMIFVF